MRGRGSHSRRIVLAVGIFLVAFLWSSFFLQGLRLFDNDYNFWIRRAREDPFAKTLGETLNPILSGWNVNFRPFQVLIFQVLFPVLGYHASGYYYFKSVILGLLCAVYFLFLGRYLRSGFAAFASPIILLVSCSTFTSLYWVSDFVILSELLALLVFFLFLYLETREGEIPKPALLLILAGMLLLTLFCDRTKANGKLIPGILLFYIFLTDIRKLKRYGILLVFMIFILVPWKVVLKNPIPPFIADPRKMTDVYSWQPAASGKFWLLFGRDFKMLSLGYKDHPPISILAILGFPLVYSAIAGCGIIFYRFLPEKNLAAGAMKKWREFRKSPGGRVILFLFCWGTVNIVSLASYPTLPPHFRSRYAISVLIPLLPLVLVVIERGAGSIVSEKRKAVRVFLWSLLSIQILFQGYQTFRMRNDFPSFIIASDRARDYIAGNIRESSIFYLNLPIMSYRPTDTGNRFYEPGKQFNLTAAAKKLGVPLEKCYVLSANPVKSPYLHLKRDFPGVSESLYDRIMNSGDSRVYKRTMYLYEVKY